MRTKFKTLVYHIEPTILSSPIEIFEKYGIKVIDNGFDEWHIMYPFDPYEPDWEVIAVIRGSELKVFVEKGVSKEFYVRLFNALRRSGIKLIYLTQY